MRATDTRASVTEALRAILSEHLRRVPDDDAGWEAEGLADMGLDSMAAIEVVLAVEEHFGVEFPEELLVWETFATLGSLESVVRDMVGVA